MGKSKANKNGSKGAGILLILFGVLLAFASAGGFIADADFIFNGADDINTMIEECRLESGEFTRVRIDANFGAYAETKHTINGFIPAGKEQHYLVWLDDGSLISVTVKGSDRYDKMDAIEEQTYNYIDNGALLSSSVTYVGKISSVYGDLKKYYQEALDYFGADSTNATIYYLDIDTTETKGSIIGTTLGILAFSVFLIVMGFITIKDAKKRKQAAAQLVNPAPYTQNMAGTNMYTGTQIGDAGTALGTYTETQTDDAGTASGTYTGDAGTASDIYTGTRSVVNENSDIMGGYSSGFDSSYYNNTTDDTEN